MKRLKAYKSLILFSLFIIAGCNATNPEKPRAAYIDIPYPECCPCQESGYYYNGYNENGWRYCVVKLPNDTGRTCEPITPSRCR